MKKLLFYFVAFVFTIFGCSDELSIEPKNINNDIQSDSPEVLIAPDECGITTPLYAGQTIDVGSVSVWNDDENLYVNYTTKDGWYLKETHIFAGDCDAMPLTKKGNPKIGHFPYNDSFSETYPTEFTRVIPLTDFADCFCVSTHAVVAKMNNDGSEDSETAFGYGENEFEGPRWGWFFEYCLEDCDDEPEPEITCETAFAYATDEQGNCFLDDGFSRWGWVFTDYSASDLATELVVPLYAGAGKCDLSKGTLVGYLSVKVIGSEAFVSFDMMDGFTLSETHVYIGSDKYPLKNGSPTVAPGQYGNIHDLDDASEDAFVIDISKFNSLNMIFHASVCGEFE